MATFNGGQYLQEQLDSFVNQTRLPEELIITDDCSTDKTIAIIKKFYEIAPFPVFFYQNDKTLGYAGNFNRALSLTSGDIVFLSDQDDVWFPEKIERITELAQSSSALVIMNDAALTDENLNATGLTKIGQIRSGRLRDSAFVMGCCAAVKRDLLTLCLPILEGYHAHDNWIVRIAEGMGRRVITNEVLQYYRRHEQNSSKFIANRIKKITKLSVLNSNLKDLIFSRNTISSNIDQEELFIKGVNFSISRSQDPYTSELQKYLDILVCNYKNQKVRLDIRKKTRLKRILPILFSYKKGVYNEFSGLKSCLRDIVFK
jgi:glycosyltransferase involved in cell wall biosynthesis